MDRAAVAAFVTSTIERCRARIQPLIDRERIVARDRLDAAERARTMRLARRDRAIEASMVATLRTRAAVSGWLQPLLFDDIASEKTTMAGAYERNGRSLLRDEGGRALTSDGSGRAVASEAMMHGLGPHSIDVPIGASIGAPIDAEELVNPSLVMVLVLR